MKSKVSIFVVVHTIHSFPIGDELLINYNFRRPPTTCQICLAVGLPLDVSLVGKGKKNLIILYLLIFNGIHVNVLLSLKLCFIRC